MQPMRVFHHTFSESGTKTISLNSKPHRILVKNLTSADIIFSWGTEISETSYVIIPSYIAELLEYDLIPHEDLIMTIQALGTGVIEARIIDD